MELVELILAFVDQKLLMTNFLLKKKIYFFLFIKKWLREHNLRSEKFLFLNYRVELREQEHGVNTKDRQMI